MCRLLQSLYKHEINTTKYIAITVVVVVVGSPPPWWGYLFFFAVKLSPPPPRGKLKREVYFFFAVKRSPPPRGKLKRKVFSFFALKLSPPHPPHPAGNSTEICFRREAEPPGETQTRSFFFSCIVLYFVSTCVNCNCYPPPFEYTHRYHTLHAYFVAHTHRKPLCVQNNTHEEVCHTPLCNAIYP